MYCVAPGGEEMTLGEIGIEGHAVYTVAHEGTCALVHDCPAQPYQSEDGSIAVAWVLTHHQVVEAAWKRWGTVLPLTFNTIIRVEGGNSAQRNLAAWLEMEYSSLKGKLEAVRGKAEYVVQVFWDLALISRRTAESSPEIRRLEEEIGSKPRGLAYMYRQKLEAMLKKQVEARAEEECGGLLSRLSRCTENIHVEKAGKGEGGRQILVNLSCLVPGGRLTELEAEMDRITSIEGFSVRLVGPLPPYSFY